MSVLDRQYLMTLFTLFYENASDDVKKQLTNPRTCMYWMDKWNKIDEWIDRIEWMNGQVQDN